MENKIKKCQSCKSEFIIEPNDFSFYKRMGVSDPTFCPICRNKRRMSWRNERSLYKTICAKTQKPIIVMFPPEEKLVVYDRDVWWKEGFDPLKYGQDINFETPILSQFRQLFGKVPLPSLLNENVVNSSYCNCVHNTKNGYLLFASMNTENVSYSTRVIGAKDSLDLFGGFNQDLCYENIMCDKSQHLFFSERSAECIDSYFLSDCKNLSNCVACVNLRNVSYYIFNKPYTKEEYKKILREFNMSSYESLSQLKDKFLEFKKIFPKKYANILRCYSVTGDNIANSKNCKYCFDAYKNLEDCAFDTHTLDLKDGYDGYGVGDNAELMYEVVDSGVNASNFISTICVHECHNVYYSYNCHNSSNLFACVGLRNKHYCILNKQYTKEEYENLIPKIIEHMNNMPYIDSKNRIYKYGEFFPSELSPFCYNETIAQEYFPLDKEDAIEQGYKWKEKEERNYNIDIKSNDLPDDINDVSDDLINKIIECKHQGKCNEQCTSAFKIIEDEFNFYKRMGLPIPRFCPNCRHSQRLSQINPLNLWHRSCMKEGCINEFETSYSREGSEIIYCEKCYQQEVY